MEIPSTQSVDEAIEEAHTESEEVVAEGTSTDRVRQTEAQAEYNLPHDRQNADRRGNGRSQSHYRRVAENSNDRTRQSCGIKDM